MSKDPFEELFGPLDDAEPETQPAAEPVSARERLSYEQAERVRTAPLPTKSRKAAPAAGAAGDSGDVLNRVANAKPWIIVGIITVVALIVSIIVVNVARGSGEAEPAPEPTRTPSVTAAPTPSAPVEDEEEDEAEEEDEGVPTVEVGPTNTMPIGPWNATSELSQRFGQTTFSIPDGTNLVLANDLLNSFPEPCVAMRQGWGATKNDDGTYSVLKPETRCDAAPELYDEVWGLVDAWVQTIK